MMLDDAAVEAHQFLPDSTHEGAQLFLPDSANNDDVSGRFFTLLNSTQAWRIAATGGLVVIAIGGLLLFLLIVRAAFNKFSYSSAYSLDRNNYYDNNSYYEYKRYFHISRNKASEIR
jgi:hypothetical protein